jgi:phospholipid/cholesterol/gamma-HCH transport system ATP-binding protein
MFQHGGLFGALTVTENIGLPLREHTAQADREIDRIAAEKLAMTGLRRKSARNIRPNSAAAC